MIMMMLMTTRMMMMMMNGPHPVWAKWEYNTEVSIRPLQGHGPGQWSPTLLYY